MRAGWMIIAVLCGAATGAATGAAADPARARAANARGYALHKQKKYAGAAAEYRKAIAEDGSYVFAHYNLACATALTKDFPASIHELEWLVDRAAWDPDAHAAAVKARTDRDLAWVFDQSADGERLTADEVINRGVLDLLDDKAADFVGQAAPPQLLAASSAAPGKHDAACSNVAFSVAIDKQASASVVASLRDGVALIDAGGKLLARVEPSGCMGPGAHPSRLVETAAVEYGAAYTEDRLMRARLVLMTYLGAGAVDRLAVFVITREHQLVRAFDVPIASKDGDGVLQQTRTLGTLLYKAPGDRRLHVLSLDPGSWTYVEEK